MTGGSARGDRVLLLRRGLLLLYVVWAALAVAVSLRRDGRVHADVVAIALFVAPPVLLGLPVDVHVRWHRGHAAWVPWLRALVVLGQAAWAWYLPTLAFGLAGMDEHPPGAVTALLLFVPSGAVLAGTWAWTDRVVARRATSRTPAAPEPARSP